MQKCFTKAHLAPEVKEEILGTAEVKDLFKSPKFGLIAGSIVIEGTIKRNKPIRVLRDNIVIFGGDLDAVTGKRCTFAFFPWNWDRGDGCIIRLVAMIDKNQSYRIESGESF